MPLYVHDFVPADFFFPLENKIINKQTNAEFLKFY